MENLRLDQERWMRLALHAKQYVEEQATDQNSQQQRSNTNSRDYQEWQADMTQRYGGMNGRN